MSIAEPVGLLAREEVVATVFNIADITVDVRAIRWILEENGEEEEEQEGDR